MIVSTSGAEVVEPIGEMLGADRVIATRMVVEDGRYTGEIEFYAYGENKADGDPRAGRDRRATTSPSCYAYSDSVTDLPMLEAVGHPYAVNPDRALRKEALRARLAGAGVHQAGAAARPVHRREPAAADHAGRGRDGRRRRDRRAGVARRPRRRRGVADPAAAAACRCGRHAGVPPSADG